MNKNRIIEIGRAIYPKTDSSPRSRHLCFAFKKSKLLAIGLNRSKSHPRNLRFNHIDREGNHFGEVAGVHAEMDSVLKLGYQEDYNKIVFVKVRLNMQNEVCLSRPCRACAGLFAQISPKKVIYTNTMGEFEEFN